MSVNWTLLPVEEYGMADFHAFDDVDVVIVPADFEAWLDEVFGKPQLGIEDSCGLVDCDTTEELIDARMDEDYWRSGQW